LAIYKIKISFYKDIGSSSNIEGFSANNFQSILSLLFLSISIAFGFKHKLSQSILFSKFSSFLIIINKMLSF